MYRRLITVVSPELFHAITAQLVDRFHPRRVHDILGYTEGHSPMPMKFDTFLSSFGGAVVACLTRNQKVACSRPLQCCHLGIGSLNHKLSI